MVKNKISLSFFLSTSPTLLLFVGKKNTGLRRIKKAGMEGTQDAWRIILQMRHVHANAESVAAGAGLSSSQVYYICRGKSRGGQTCAFRKYLDESRISPDGIDHLVALLGDATSGAPVGDLDDGGQRAVDWCDRQRRMAFPEQFPASTAEHVMENVPPLPPLPPPPPPLPPCTTTEMVQVDTLSSTQQEQRYVSRNMPLARRDDSPLHSAAKVELTGSELDEAGFFTPQVSPRSEHGDLRLYASSSCVLGLLSPAPAVLSPAHSVGTLAMRGAPLLQMSRNNSGCSNVHWTHLQEVPTSTRPSPLLLLDSDSNSDKGMWSLGSSSPKLDPTPPVDERWSRQKSPF